EDPYRGRGRSLRLDECRLFRSEAMARSIIQDDLNCRINESTSVESGNPPEPMTELPDTVTLGVQSSGDNDRTDKHVLELRRLLAASCKGPYSEEITEFALVLRIGGKMQVFDFEGCEHIRRNRKDKYITVDLGFPSRRWR